MRKTRLPLIPSVLASALVVLVATPVAVSAASGLPSTITMTPENAGPGSRIEIVGLDFPGVQSVDLQLTTTAGAVHLATAITQEGGYFRHALTLPTDIAAGFWELRATAESGAVAVHIFDATKGAAPVAAAVSAAAALNEPANAKNSGLIDSNLLVLLVLVLLIGVIGGAAAYVWQQMRRPEGEPGLPSGDDPIWSGATSETR